MQREPASQMDFARYTARDVAGYSKLIHDLKWNREGNYIGMVSADKTVKVGQLDKNGSFQNVHTIPNSAQMAQVVWNPQDDSRIGMCGDDKAVELWDVRASKAHAKLGSAGSNINMAWSPCGTYVAVGNKSDVVQVFDVRTSAIIRKKKFAYEVNGLCWTANPNYLLAATGGDGVGSIDVLSLELGDQQGDTLAAPSSAGSSSGASNAGSASGSGSAAVGELDLADTVAAHVSNCLHLSTDAELRRLAVGSLDHCVSFWNLDDLICTHTVNVESEVRGLSFSGDGAYLAVVSAEDTHIVICDTAAGEAVSRIPCRHKLNAVAWHPRQAVLCAAVDDRSPSPQFLRFVCLA